MKNSNNTSDKLREAMNIMESSGLENHVCSSAKNKVLTEFSTWIASLKNINLAAKAKELWRYLNDCQVPLSDKAVIVAALVYCISPIDLVPDHIPLAGLLDDLSVVLRVMAFVAVDGEVEKHHSSHPSDPEPPDSMRRR
jgi:uncharacterized membrane protein YkvA (DUF1232 family)